MKNMCKLMFLLYDANKKQIGLFDEYLSRHPDDLEIVAKRRWFITINNKIYKILSSLYMKKWRRIKYVRNN